MRSIPLKAVTTVLLASAWACGGDGGNVEPNNPPVANFTAGPNCTAGAACQFTSTSTDDHGITTYAWNFGDANVTNPADNTSDQQNPTHTYSQAGQYTVTLTVTDADGESNTKTNNVTIGGGTTGQAPVASFDLPTDCTAGTPCGFHSTSTDPDGDIANATFAWNFGDQTEAGDGADVTHTFGAAGTFNVQLTVTDEQGNSNSVTQSLTVNDAAPQDCITGSAAGTRVVSCTLTMTQRSTVKFTWVSSACQLSANQLRVTAPRDQYVFFNMCTRPVNTESVVKDAAGAPLVFEAGSQIAFRFEQGDADPTDPPVGDPGIQITGTFPNWTLNIDDGGAFQTEGEPDFNDAIITVTATPQ